MPRARSTSKNALTNDDLIYLAGIFESSLGLRGVGTTNAISISSGEEWPKFMAERYGGTHEQFTSARGKTYWGWFVPLQRRYELVKELEAAKVTHSISPSDWDGIRGKLQKAYSNETLGKDLD